MLNITQFSSTLWTLLSHTEHLNPQTIKCHNPKMRTTSVFACLESCDSGADQVEQWGLYWISRGPCWDGCQLMVKGPWKMGSFRTGVCCGVALFTTPSKLVSHLLLRTFLKKKQNHTFSFYNYLTTLFSIKALQYDQSIPFIINIATYSTDAIGWCLFHTLGANCFHLHQLDILQHQMWTN